MTWLLVIMSTVFLLLGTILLEKQAKQLYSKEILPRKLLRAVYLLNRYIIPPTTLLDKYSLLQIQMVDWYQQSGLFQNMKINE